MNDKELDLFCWAWNRWCNTRKFYAPPTAQNFLARMRPSKVGVPPNAACSDELSFFNMAVHALADMGDPDVTCFWAYYAECVENIKAVAAKMGVHRDTFYERKRRFARRALSMSISLKRAHNTAMAAFTAADEVD